MYMNLMDSPTSENNIFIRWYPGPLSANYNKQYYNLLDVDYEAENPFWAPCFVCTLPFYSQKSVILVLSGLCKSSKIDTHYQMFNDEKGLLTYFGFLSTVIRYNTHLKTWILIVENRPSIVATCGASYSTFLLGNHE